MAAKTSGLEKRGANMAVVRAVNKGAADPHLMQLLYNYTSLLVCHVQQFSGGTTPPWSIKYISWCSLAYNNYPLFSALNPQVMPVPSGVPAIIQ